MNELDYRSNIIARKVFKKDVFIYEDHRYILNILSSAFHSKILTEAPTLVYFDKHDDGKDSTVPIDRIKQVRNNVNNLKEMWSFVEWELSTQDDDWLKVGMELGLIGDAILLGCNDASNFEDFRNIYKDHLGVEHLIFNVGHIWSGLSHQGWLVDRAQRNKYSEIWDLLGIENNQRISIDPEKQKTKVILDFDLDCFTTSFLEDTLPWQYEYFKKYFYKPCGRDYNRPKEFIDKLIRTSEFITIARETDYCGSFQNNAQIFDSVNDIIFDNEL
jgi:hypothetical protein